MAVYLLLSGCALQTAQRELPASEQQLLGECRPSLTAKACSGSPDETARNLCFEQGAWAYAERPTQKSRRRWLLANGCPAEIINGGTTAIAVLSTVPTAPTPLETTTEAAPIEQEHPKFEASPVASEANEGVVQASLVNDTLPTSSVTSASPVPGPNNLPPAPQLNRGARAKAQLREAIVAHQPEMKRCVDRQLKLVPTLKAEGMLVVDVDAHGQVPRVELKGKDLSGTALELCLRTAASRWRFPRTGRSYSIEAPLVVTGRQDPS